MVVLDILVISIFTIFLVLGMWKGIIGSVFKIAGIISGLVLSFIFYKNLAKFLSPFLTIFKEQNALSFILSFIMILMVTILVFLVGAKFISSILETLKIKWLDNLIGGLFALSIALIINSGIIFGANTLYENNFYPEFKNSLSKQYILPILIDLRSFLMRDKSFKMKDIINVDKIKENASKKIDNIKVKNIIPDSLSFKDLKKLKNEILDNKLDSIKNKK